MRIYRRNALAEAVDGDQSGEYVTPNAPPASSSVSRGQRQKASDNDSGVVDLEDSPPHSRGNKGGTRV